MGSATEKEPGFRSRRLTEVMGIAHTGIHTLSGLGRMRVTSIARNKDAFTDGEF